MCSNYEKQLQAIQGQEAETRDQVCCELPAAAAAAAEELVFSGINSCFPGEETAGDVAAGQRAAREDDD